MTKAEFELLLRVATQGLGFTIRPFYNSWNEPYNHIVCSAYRADSIVYIDINIKTIKREHIPEIVEIAKEKHRVRLLQQSDTLKPELGSIYTHDRYSLLWHDDNGNLIPVSEQERGFLASLVSGDHSAWRPYIDYLSEQGLDLQARILQHYLQQYERIMANATTNS